VRVTGGCFYHKQPGRLNPAAREALGAEAFETAQVERAALSVEQAIAEAMEETTPSGSGDSTHDRVATEGT
jgi:hypothetical protein